MASCRGNQRAMSVMDWEPSRSRSPMSSAGIVEGPGVTRPSVARSAVGGEWSPLWLSQRTAAPAVGGGPMKSQAAWRVWNVKAEELSRS